MTEEKLQQLASNLRKPDGEFGKEVGQRMNENNRYINQYTIEALNPKPGDNILEVGPGNGHFVKEIVGSAGEIAYTGIDFSATMIEEANRINSSLIRKGNVRFILTAAEQLPFHDLTFNKIFTVNTIYFWKDPVITLAEFKRVLKKQGELIISVRPRSTMEHLPFVKYGFSIFDKAEISDLLTTNGFAVTGSVERTEPPQTINGNEVKLETLIVKAKSI